MNFLQLHVKPGQWLPILRYNPVSSATNGSRKPRGIVWVHWCTHNGHLESPIPLPIWAPRYRFEVIINPLSFKSCKTNSTNRITHLFSQVIMALSRGRRWSRFSRLKQIRSPSFPAIHRLNNECGGKSSPIGAITLSLRRWFTLNTFHY